MSFITCKFYMLFLIVMIKNFICVDGRDFIANDVVTLALHTWN